jgi:hypothetical protein
MKFIVISDICGELELVSRLAEKFVCSSPLIDFVVCCGTFSAESTSSSKESCAMAQGDIASIIGKQETRMITLNFPY